MPAALQQLLRQKLLDGVQQPLPRLTRRDTWIPRIPGKTLAVIGMRRSGKTSLLWQELGERVAAGASLFRCVPISVMPPPVAVNCGPSSRSGWSRSVLAPRPA